MIRSLFIFSFLFIISGLYAQESDRNTNYLATFGNMSSEDCVDDDFSQTSFIAVPTRKDAPFYIRVLDPDCGGKLDIPNGHWETNTIFEIFGGKGCISEGDARETQPVGAYKSGILLDQAIFGKESLLDGKWFAFGPFNTDDGEMLSGYPGYSFFKIIVEGHTGNDANVYGFFISSSKKSNRLVDQTRIFAYEELQVLNDDFVMSRNESYSDDGGDIRIPIALKILHSTPEFNIIAEPIDD